MFALSVMFNGSQIRVCPYLISAGMFEGCQVRWVSAPTVCSLPACLIAVRLGVSAPTAMFDSVSGTCLPLLHLYRHVLGLSGQGKCLPISLLTSSSAVRQMSATTSSLPALTNKGNRSRSTDMGHNNRDLNHLR